MSKSLTSETFVYRTIISLMQSEIVSFISFLAYSEGLFFAVILWRSKKAIKLIACVDTTRVLCMKINSTFTIDIKLFQPLVLL